MNPGVKRENPGENIKMTEMEGYRKTFYFLLFTFYFFPLSLHDAKNNDAEAGLSAIQVIVVIKKIVGL